MATVYEIVTEQIIEQLNKGVIPWKKSWQSGIPRNGISKKEYTGINPFLLSVRGYTNPYWFSFKQVGDAGGFVKKGEKSTLIIFGKTYTKPDPDKQEGEISIKELQSHLVMRYYRVFNAEQCEGLDTEKYGTPKLQVFNRIEAAEKIVASYTNAPVIQHEEQRAYYMPRLDRVNMPKKETFIDELSYYGTLFHELIHSTGHESRLNREMKGLNEDKTDYSKEELIAEMGASYLSARAGIFNQSQLEQAGAYIQGWLKALKNDPQMVVSAAAKAQKASDYIAGAGGEDEIN